MLQGAGWALRRTGGRVSGLYAKTRPQKCEVAALMNSKWGRQLFQKNKKNYFWVPFNQEEKLKFTIKEYDKAGLKTQFDFVQIMPFLLGFINQGACVHINDRNVYCNVYVRLKIACLK